MSLICPLCSVHLHRDKHLDGSVMFIAGSSLDFCVTLGQPLPLDQECFYVQGCRVSLQGKVTSALQALRFTFCEGGYNGCGEAAPPTEWTAGDSAWHTDRCLLPACGEAALSSHWLNTAQTAFSERGSFRHGA